MSIDEVFKSQVEDCIIGAIAACVDDGEMIGGVSSLAIVDAARQLIKEGYFDVLREEATRKLKINEEEFQRAIETICAYALGYVQGKYRDGKVGRPVKKEVQRTQGGGGRGGGGWLN